MRSCPLGIVKWGTRGDFVILVHWAGQTFLQGINYLLREGKSRKESGELVWTHGNVAGQHNEHYRGPLSVIFFVRCQAWHQLQR